MVPAWSKPLNELIGKRMRGPGLNWKKALHPYRGALGVCSWPSGADFESIKNHGALSSLAGVSVLVVRAESLSLICVRSLSLGL